MNPKHRFHYHASGHAFSGELTRPVQRVIAVQAAASLPTIGGVGASFVENFRVDEVVAFKRGSAHVSGSLKEEGGKITHTTHVTATIEGLNILDIVTADRIVAHLSSSFEEPLPNRPRPTESQVQLVGSKFENLCFAGYQMDVELHHELFLGLATHEAVKTAWSTAGSDFRTRADETSDAIPEGKPPKLDLHDAVLCSVVKEVHFKDPGFGRRQGAFAHPGVTGRGRHAYHIVDFGDVFLAEVLCQHGRKTLTMLRIELGSPNGGSFIGAEVTTNGWPPWG